MKLKKDALTDCYYNKLLLFGGMEYYSMKEDAREDSLAEIIDAAVTALLTDRGKAQAKEALSLARGELMDRMDILTAYVDRLEVYQYALNRIELRFAKEIEAFDEGIFVQRTMEYIFSTRDNLGINERIKEVLGQLPVRMTKGKYFERLKNSLTIYKGAERASLDSMLYVLRTSGMLYSPKKKEEYYEAYAKALERLEQLDFSTMTREKHQEMERLLDSTGESIREEMEHCMLLAELINHFYGVYLLEDRIAEEKRLTPELRRLLEASRAGNHTEALKELEKLEGRQEQLLEREAALEQGLFEAELQEPGVRELLMARELGSDSLFMELDGRAEEAVVDSRTIEEEAEKLFAELNALFLKTPKRMKRAIMANTLSKLPVFFASSQEIMEYIQNSLEQCHDMEEKIMSMKLIYQMMEG